MKREQPQASVLLEIPDCRMDASVTNDRQIIFNSDGRTTPPHRSLAGLDLLLTPPGSPRVEVSHGFQHSHQPSCFGEKTAVIECSRSARRYLFGALGELIDGPSREAGIVIARSL